MPFDNFYSNGDFRFIIPKTIPQDILPVSLPSNVIKIIKGCSIKTDVIDYSYKIVDNADNTQVIAHFSIEDTVGWTVQGAQIVLTSADHINYYLIFSNEEEAVIGDLRLFKIMEGGSIINCGDENF